MHTILSTARTCIAITILTLLFASTASARTLRMNIAYSNTEAHPFGTFMKVFAERFTALSNKTVRVKVFCCHKMGSEQEQFKKVQLGTLDGTMIAQNNAAPFFPKLDLLILPYIFKSQEHARKIIDGPIGNMIWGDMPQSIGVHLIAMPYVSFRHIYNTRKPINTISDFSTLKYRVPKNVVMIDTYKAFGANPTPLAWSEAFTATQTGAVDGGDLPLDVQYAQKFHEIAKHVAMTGHFILAPPFFVSDRFLQKLSPSQRTAFNTAIEVASAATMHHTELEASTTLQKMKTAGVNFTRPNLKPWTAAAKKVRSQFAVKRGEEYRKILAAIEASAI